MEGWATAEAVDRRKKIVPRRFPRRAKEAKFLSRNEEGTLLLLILFVRVLSRDDNKVLA